MSHRRDGAAKPRLETGPAAGIDGGKRSVDTPYRHQNPVSSVAAGGRDRVTNYGGLFEPLQLKLGASYRPYPPTGSPNVGERKPSLTKPWLEGL